MKVRILTSIGIAAVGIPLLIFSNTVVFALAVSLISAVSTFEILRVIGAHKNLVLAIPSYAVALVFPVVAFIMGEKTVEYIAILATSLFAYLMYLFFVAVFTRGSLKFSHICETFAGATYVTASLGAMCALRYLTAGVWNLILVFLGAWVCDMFAYFGGTLFGKHKLIPEVSPKKTVEGSLIGVLSTALAFVLYGFILSRFTDYIPNYTVLAVAGVIVPVVSQLGALVASLIKREHGIKDYGSIFPGHGGVMDRFDSMLAVALPLLLICIVFPPFS